MSVEGIQDLWNLYQQNSSPIASGLMTLEEKDFAIQSLKGNLISNAADQDHLYSILSVLKLMIREGLGCDALVNSETVELLLKLGGIDPVNVAICTSNHGTEALKCLVNLQVIIPRVRSVFVSSSKLLNVVDALKQDGHSGGSYFLLTRLLFFAAAEKSDLGKTFVDMGVLDLISKVLEQLETCKMEDWISKDMLIAECLKTGFNITIGSSPLAVSLIPSPIESPSASDNTLYHNYLKSIVKVCNYTHITNPGGLSGIHDHAINAIMNVPTSSADIWFSEGNLKIIAVFLDIFESCLKEMVPSEPIEPPKTIFNKPFDQALIPLCIVMKRLASIPGESRSTIKARLAPSNIDRTKKLTDGNELTAFIFRAITSIALTETRNFICDVLLTCFDENMNQLVAYCGYGNLAGYLFTKGITNPQSVGIESNTESNALVGVDPISGTLQRDNPKEALPEMTDEEKEREAERLFVLLDKLEKSGAIQVKRK